MEPLPRWQSWTYAQFGLNQFPKMSQKKMQDSQQKQIDTLKNLFEAVLKQNGSAITKAQLKMEETIEMWKITMKESYNKYNKYQAEVNDAREKMAEP